MYSPADYADTRRQTANNMNHILSTMRYLSLSARSVAYALADPFTKLSFVCVNLRDLRENMPLNHIRKNKQIVSKERASLADRLSPLACYSLADYAENRVG